MMKLQKMKRNGQMTIPKDIRDKLNIDDGDYLTVELRENDIVVNVVDLETSLRWVMGEN